MSWETEDGRNNSTPEPDRLPGPVEVLRCEVLAAEHRTRARGEALPPEGGFPLLTQRFVFGKPAQQQRGSLRPNNDQFIEANS